jgi:hypothetical protein
VCAFGIARAEHSTDDHLAGDRDRVQKHREQEEELRRDLMRAKLRVSDARAHRRRNEKRRPERSRAYEDLPADSQHRLHLAQTRTLRVRVGPQELDDKRNAHAALSDCRSRGRSGDTPVEAVDEEQLERDIRRVRGNDDLERPPQARDASQIPLPGERDECRRKSDRRDPEVGQRVCARPPVTA